MNINFKQRLQVAMKSVVGIFSDNSLNEAQGLLTRIFDEGTPPKRGTKEFLKAFSTMPWLHAVSSRVATSTASIKWKLFVREKSGKAIQDRGWQYAAFDERQKMKAYYKKQMQMREIETHPLLDLLETGNSFHVGLSVRKLTQVYLDLIGEAYLIKDRGPLNVPTRLWPIPAHWVKDTPTPSKRFFDVQFGRERVQIPDTNMLWMMDPDPENPYGRGIGISQSLGDDLETDEFAAKHTKQFFYNNARPDFLVFPKGENATGMPRGNNEADIRRLEQYWTDRQQGFWKRHRPLFLNNEVGIHEFSAQNFRNLQMVDLRQFERDTILQVWGVSPEILGVLESSNRATIEAANFLYGLWVVLPRMEFQRAIFQKMLVPEFDERLILDFESPVQEDKEHNLKAASSAPHSLTVDEWRELMGQEPKEDGSGNVHIVQQGLRSVGSLSELTGEGESNSNLQNLTDDELRQFEDLTMKMAVK